MCAWHLSFLDYRAPLPLSKHCLRFMSALQQSGNNNDVHKDSSTVKEEWITLYNLHCWQTRIKPSWNNQSKTFPYQLIISDFRTIFIKHEPPRWCRNSCSSNINSNSHVSKEEPAADERFFSLTWWLHHDIYIRRVEAERGGWRSICH